jgi:MinD-like ATPase involved in chromosome partitioning or flagellar assembly
MLVACWSVKGGVGTTVVAASLALLLGRRGGPGIVLADLAGDGPAVLGLPEPESPGLAGWLAAGDDVPADGLARLEVRASPRLALLPRGPGPLLLDRAAVLASLLDRGPRPVVVDCGATERVATALVEGAQRSILVIRPCYLALRRAMASSLRPSEVVVIREPGRTLSRHDVESAVGAPVRAEIEADPAVARAVDSGLMAGRLPRSLERGLRRAA